MATGKNPRTFLYWRTFLLQSLVMMAMYGVVGAHIFVRESSGGSVGALVFALQMRENPQ